MGVAAKAQDIGVFVSSTLTSGNMGGLDGGDAICQDLGSTAIPGSGPWTAWLSTFLPRMDASDRIPTPGTGGAYVRAAQPTTVIADDLADLTDGFLANPILLTEFGVAYTATSFVWTGTRFTGFSTNATCGVWDDTVAVGSVGRPGGTDFSWSGNRSPIQPCDQFHAIYCFGELPPAAPVLPTPALLALVILLVAGGAYFYRRRQPVG